MVDDLEPGIRLHGVLAEVEPLALLFFGDPHAHHHIDWGTNCLSIPNKPTARVPQIPQIR